MCVSWSVYVTVIFTINMVGGLFVCCSFYSLGIQCIQQNAVAYWVMLFAVACRILETKLHCHGTISEEAEAVLMLGCSLICLSNDYLVVN